MENQNKSLIITSWAPPMIGGPMNLYNIFSQFPKDSYGIFTGYSSIKNQPHDNNYWLDCKYYFFDHPNKSKGDMISEDKIINHNTEKTNTDINTKLWKIFTSIINKLSIFKRIDLLIFLLIQLLVIVPRGVKIVKKDKYQVLIGISGDGLALLSTYLISKITKKKYIIYLFDLYKGNKHSPAINLLSKIAEPLLIRNSSMTIVTNSATKDLYQKRYGNIPIEIIYNAIYSNKYEKFNNTYEPKEPFNITFTGHIYWAQEQSVLNLIEAVKRINEIKINLNFYLPKCPENIVKIAKEFDKLKISKASPEEIPAIQNSADILFLPLAWDTEAPEIIQTATPGKFTDYLIAGRPMLIHAPEYSFVSQYAKKYNLGIVVDNNDINELSEKIVNFLNNPEMGKIYIKNSNHIFYKNHTVDINVKRMMNILKNI